MKNSKIIKPSILDVSIVHESGLEFGATMLFGLEKSTGRLYIFEFDKYIGELGEWSAGRFLMKNESGKWQSNHSFSTTGAIEFDTFEEIAKYWNENMVCHDTVSRGSKEWEDSILNGYICEMSEGMHSLSHVG
jgi:hypothetical protein